MANVDFPRGLWPIRLLNGGCDFTANTYVMTTGQTIYRGDIVKVVAGGTITVAAATDGALAVGVAAEYVDDSASAGGKTIRVYDNPSIVFGIQSDGTPAQTNVFDCADPTTYAAGSNGVSITELSSTMGSAQAQFKILGLVKDPQNSFGAHADLEVIFNEHFYKEIGAGPS